jgi:hypothetical protein
MQPKATQVLNQQQMQLANDFGDDATVLYFTSRTKTKSVS